MLKTVKNGCGIRVDPPPCFFKIPTFSRFFGGGASLIHISWRDNVFLFSIQLKLDKLGCSRFRACGKSRKGKGYGSPFPGSRLFKDQQVYPFECFCKVCKPATPWHRVIPVPLAFPAASEVCQKLGGTMSLVRLLRSCHPQPNAGEGRQREQTDGRLHVFALGEKPQLVEHLQLFHPSEWKDPICKLDTQTRWGGINTDPACCLHSTKKRGQKKKVQ